MLKNQLFIFAAILIGITNAQAQSKNVYHDNFVWTQYIWRGQVSNKVSIHTDLGYRTHDYYKSKAQYFVRVGAIYQISPKVNIQAGYAYFSTNQFLSGYEEVMRPEQRFYQRLTVVQQAGRFEIRNRYRLEERFNANISKGVIQDGYTESFRVGYQIYVPFRSTMKK